jgi:pimeloyl-ACP methyl ester carboxylesterase
MTEPTRPIPHTVAEDGSLVAHTVATPKAFKVRALVTVPPEKVIPVVFVPGVMGTNLRVRNDVALPKDFPLDAGSPAWRPPCSKPESLWEAHKWSSRRPEERQLMLNPDFLEVDDGGELDVEQCALTPKEMRERGWGEIFNGSYGSLLFQLQSNLDTTFRTNLSGEPEVREHWKEVMGVDPWKEWGVRNVHRITKDELRKYAAYQYPVYAVGYNWLQSCAVSAERLEKRIGEIIEWWQHRKFKCDQVILVTHSMGGLVARVCAKNIPGKIAGIVHGVLPALGAPVAYRRLACGMEDSSPSNSEWQDFIAARIADVVGHTPQETTPVMSVSPGVLELLPNQLYPRPWLHVRVMRTVSKRRYAYDYLHLPQDENPYTFYRDTKAWYRLVDPTLADPRGLYLEAKGGVGTKISSAISTAEKLHAELGDYYHERSYAFYGADKQHLAYGQIRWVAEEPASAVSTALSASAIRDAKFIECGDDGSRTVELEGGYRLRFTPEPQDAPGDGTVPQQSGAGPARSVAQIFPSRGFGHQDSFQNHSMVLLTRHLIVKIVQGLK